MRRVLHIARREWLEQVRQPVMLAVIAALFGILAALVLTTLALIDFAAAEPERVAGVEAMLGSAVDGAVALDAMAGTTVVLYSFLIFTQFLGISAVLAGHAVLHDRQCGTLTFLLLAPVRRTELVLGKVAGALGPSLLLYYAISGVGTLVASRFSVTAPHAAHLPTHAGWWIAFLLGGPAWAAFIGTICATVSALAHDVRTAQQSVWFVVFFATLAAGYMLTAAMTQGALAQGAVALLGGVGTVGGVVAGSAVIRRDLGR